MAVNSQAEKMTKGEIQKWIMLVLFTGCIFLVPTTVQMTMVIKLYCAITVFGILLLAFELTDNLVPALLIPAGYLLFEIAPANVIFQGWTTQAPWLIVGSMIISEIMNQTGLSKRIAYFCLLKAGGKFRGLLLALLLAGIILTACVPAALARTALFCGLMMSLCSAMDYKPYSKEATVALIAAFLVGSEASGIFMTGSNNFITTLGFLNTAGYDVSWGTYLLHNGLPRLIWAVFTIFLLLFVFKPNKQCESTDYLKQQYDALGAVGRSERKAIILVCLTIFLLLTGSIHKIPPGWLFVLMGCLAFFPGFKLANREMMKKVNFTMVFLVVGTVAIGNVSSHIGAGEMLIGALMPYIPSTVVGSSIMMYLIAFIGNIILTPLALIAALMVPVIEIAENLGINPLTMSYIFNMGCGQMLFPHEVTTALLMFGFGMVRMKDFIKFFTIKAICNFIFMIALVIPWYKMIGLF